MQLPLSGGSLSAAAGEGPTDAELMRQVGEGGMGALGVLVRRYQDLVRGVAYRFTGRWDMADDIAQETFLRVYRAAGSYKPTAAFSTFLYRIVVNLCLDYAKRPRLAAMPEEPAIAVDGVGGGEAMEQAERISAIRREIAALPERQRMVLVMHRFERLNHAQIAESTGWSEGAVESLLVRAYAQLRQRLRDWIEE